MGTIKEILTRMEKRLRYWLSTKKTTEEGRVAFSKVIAEIELFHMKTKGKKVDVHYRNNISGASILVEQDNIMYLYIIMILYTNVTYRIEKAYRVLNEREAKKMQSIQKEFKNSIRIFCRNSFKTWNYNEDTCLEIYHFLEITKKSLHHKVESIEEKTDIVIPKEAEELADIRSIYESIAFDFANKEICYYDYLSEKERTASLEKADFIYAIANVFSKAYVKSILWLKEQDPSEMWCPLTPWKAVRDLQILLEKIVFY